jgi:transcriptional accessory protein Tex/SPT6
VQVGDIVKARVKNISVEDRRIGLSMKEDADDGAAAATETAAASSIPAGANLGGFGLALDAALKEASDEQKQEEEPAAETEASAEPTAETEASAEPAAETEAAAESEEDK